MKAYEVWQENDDDYNGRLIVFANTAREARMGAMGFGAVMPRKIRS